MAPDEQLGDVEPSVDIMGSEPKAHTDLSPAVTPFEEMLPADTPTEVRYMMRFIGMMFGPTKSGDPLLDKLDSKQVDKFLDNLDKESQREHDRKKFEPLYTLAYIIIGVAALCWVIWYLAPNHSALLSDILKILVAAILGFGGGFGYKSWLDQRNQQ